MESIQEQVGGRLLRGKGGGTVTHLLLDSRKVVAPATSLFFALRGPRRDGHQFLEELYSLGVRQFVVSEEPAAGAMPGAEFLVVGDTLAALQQLAAAHRSRFSFPVIGLTGSNGKTIVKEWLYQLLHGRYVIVRSPKSYNSQIGVPLSVWQMEEGHTLGIFEAGISQPGEMPRLAAIIRPTLGVLTHIGEAHSEGFDGLAHKVREKLTLFAGCRQLVYGVDNLLAAGVDLERDRGALLSPQTELYGWSFSRPAWLQVREVTRSGGRTRIHADQQGRAIDLDLPFTDEASMENALTCCCVLLLLGLDPASIREGIRHLQPVNMRLEMKTGINHCTLINDAYSADLSSLEIALNFMDQPFSGTRKTAILSDFLQSALPDQELYSQILDSLSKHGFTRLIGIGERIALFLEKSGSRQTALPVTEYYWSTAEFIQQFRASHFREETILVKGARVFGFEQIVRLLEEQVHQTILEINLGAVAHNLRVHQQLLRPDTRMMVMVKAFAYGSGGPEIAAALQYHKADYLGVAYADEGVELRKGGIRLPIMVMNPEESSFDSLTEHDLEPDLYGFRLLRQFDQYLQQQGLQSYPVHIELETGMNRLGFDPEEVDQLADYLAASATLRVQSVFSHLASSDDPGDDPFTRQQFQSFTASCERLQQRLGYRFMRHIANTAAIERLPGLQLDMVRLGIGLYGVGSAGAASPPLRTVATLTSTIAQLRQIRAGESVSYNRKGVVPRDTLIATVRIGYADGYPRRLGYGTGRMLVRGQLAPVVGTVCMDMTMLDVTDIPGVQEGDPVLVFGQGLPVEQVAAWAQTIPYEIMTGISQRVKRVYFEE